MWSLACAYPSDLLLSAAVPSLAHAKTLTAVMHSDLRILDPIFTGAYITRDHGYMVYDTLLATDSNFKVQPQMADWKVSDDKLTYTFTLRDGLKWHDGVRSPRRIVWPRSNGGARTKRMGQSSHGLHRQP